jgi:hypothetical protein
VGLDWKKADSEFRKHLQPSDIGLPAKLWEWSVNDTMKAICAQQEAAKTYLIRAIYRKTSDQAERKRLTTILRTNPTADNWLHRQFRKQYQRGHTYVRNQIVYQGAGYSCKRLSRTGVIWSKSYKGNDKANFTGKAAEVNCDNLPSGFCNGGKNQITSISSWQRKSR